MRVFRRLLSASLKEFVRDRTSLSFTIVLPVLLVVFFGFAYNSSGSRMGVGIVAGGSDGNSPPSIAPLRMDRRLRLEFGSLGEELARLHDGAVDAVVLVEPKPVAHHRRRGPVVYYDSGTGAGALAAQALSAELARGRKAPNPTARVPLTGVHVLADARLDFVIPGILATAIMWLGIFAAIPLVQQREQQVLRRIALTPVGRRKLVFSQLTGRLVISLGQTLFVLAAARLLFGVPIGSQLPLAAWASAAVVVALVLLGASVFVAIGYAVAALTSTQHGAHAWAQLLTMPMLVLAGVFFPVSAMPGVLHPLVALLPLTYLADALRQTTIASQHFTLLSVDVIALGLWLIVPAAVAMRYFRWA